MMCVNIHNLFGPFTWWPTINYKIPNEMTEDKEEEEVEEEKKTATQTNSNENGRKRAREATIPKCNGIKVKKNMIIMFTHD